MPTVSLMSARKKETHASLPGRLPSAHHRLREYVETRVGRNGSVRGPCESRILESTVALCLLRQTGMYPRAQERLEGYLRARQGEQGLDALDTLLLRGALGVSSARDVEEAMGYLGRFKHFTAWRKRMMFSVLFEVLGVMPFNPAFKQEDFASSQEERYQSTVGVTLCALRVLHAMGSGHPEWLRREDPELLVVTQGLKGCWEKHLLTNILSLLALRHFPQYALLVRRGINLLMPFQNADGGFPFITGLEIFCTATAGLALAGAGSEASTLHRMADYLVSHQQPDGGWAYAEAADQTDVDDTSYCLEFLKAVSPVRYADSILRAEDYLVGMQNSDGGFPTFVARTQSESAMTAAALNAMVPSARDHSGLLARGVRYLVENQGVDGTFERSWSLSDTNAIFRALLAMQTLPESASSLRPALRLAEKRSLGYLRCSQNEDGGWGQSDGQASDPISTSYALIALSHYESPTALQRGVEYLLGQQHSQGGFVSIPDQVGPRPIVYNVLVLADIFALIALDHVVAAHPQAVPVRREFSVNQRAS